MPRIPKGEKKGRTYVGKSASFDPQMLEAAEARAARLRMSWSEYVRRCLEADLASDGVVLISPAEDESSKRKK